MSVPMREIHFQSSHRQQADFRAAQPMPRKRRARARHLILKMTPLLNKIWHAWSSRPKRDVESITAAARLQRELLSLPTLSACLPYIAYLANERVFVNQDSLGFCLEV